MTKARKGSHPFTCSYSSQTPIPEKNTFANPTALWSKLAKWRLHNRILL